MPRPLRISWPLTRLFLPVIAAGCATFPELDAAVSDAAREAPQPELVDNRPILQAAAGGQLEPGAEAELQARAKGLQQRGEVLVGPVISDAELAEIEAAQQRLEAAADRVAPDS